MFDKNNTDLTLRMKTIGLNVPVPLCQKSNLASSYVRIDFVVVYFSFSLFQFAEVVIDRRMDSVCLVYVNDR